MPRNDRMRETHVEAHGQLVGVDDEYP
jgi:hypothetical protein